MSTLTSDTARDVVIAAVSAVAPDVSAELPSLDPDIDMFEWLDLDSMDHLSVMTEIFERTGVEVPERDYGRVRSLGTLADYLVARGTAG